MRSEQWASLAFISGFVFVLIASVAMTSDLYREKEAAVRLEIIAQNRRGWFVSNLFWALAAIVTGIGFLFITYHHKDTLNIWLMAAASLAYLIGVVGWVIFAYLRTINPVPFFENYTFSPVTYVLFWGIVSGLLLYGIVFWQVGYPIWLAIFMIIFTVTLGGLALWFPAKFYANFPPQILYLLTLIAGIVIWRQ